jgi:hypothetical protein
MVQMKNPEIKQLLFLLLAVVSSSLACSPIITVGWGEIAILVVLLLVLLGPVLFKLYKRFDEFQTWKAEKAKTKEKE